MEYMTIDRIEGAFAVCEMPDGSHEDIPLSSLPEGSREGTVLARIDGIWSIDRDEERRRRGRIQSKMNSLFED